MVHDFFFRTDVVAAERTLRAVRLRRTPRFKRSPLLFAKNLSVKSFLRVLRCYNVVRGRETQRSPLALRSVSLDSAQMATFWRGCLTLPQKPRKRQIEVSAYVMLTAPVGLRRMRELRNCHFSGNFVTETAHYLGAVESKRHNAVTPFATGFIAEFTFFRKPTREIMKRYFGTVRAAGNSRGAHNKRRTLCADMTARRAMKRR